MTDSSTWLVVAVGVLLLAGTGILGYFLIQRLRAQRQRIVADLSSSPVFADDRAYNQIRIARSELDVLRREGTDVPRAGELIDQAESSLRSHQNVDAVRLAQDAHKLLVDARQRHLRPSGNVPVTPTPPATSVPPMDLGRTGPRPTVDLGLMADVEGAGPAGRPGPMPREAPDAGSGPARPPKNRVEAHFQMTLLVEELAKGAGAPGRAEAEGLRAGAQSAYAGADYTEALRLALRGRRALGVRLETLPAGRVAASVPPEGSPPAAAPASGGGSSRTCPQCGRPVRSGDRFCRGCGATSTSTQCPRCQAELGPTDTFCGRCGSPVS